MKSIIGEYHRLAEGLIHTSPGSLSLRNGKYAAASGAELDLWKKKAKTKVLEYLSPPYDLYAGTIKPVCRERYLYNGLEIEELEWQLPFGPKTEALFLKPAGDRGKLPGILALHDHGGKKFWGYKKIARGRDDPPELMKKHHRDFYGGLCWANELAKEGFAVLVHDTFPFASRRVRIETVNNGARRGYSADEPVSDEEIESYNDWASGHEHDMAKSLFSAGTTWPGVTFLEDRTALDILAARSDVDEACLGCGGLSGGGMRSVFLAGLDEKIKASFTAGFMTTWKDFSLYSGWTHTWMTFVPGLPGKLDFPEILGLRVPLPALVLNNTEDPLYTLEGMKDADRILSGVYSKAGAADNYRCSFYPGEHKLDGKMQREAFDWFKRWLV